MSSPTADLLNWSVSIATHPSDFAAAAAAAGFRFDLTPPSENTLVGKVTSAPSPRFVDPLPALLALPLRRCVEAGLERGDRPDSGLLLSLTIASRTAFTCDPGTAFAEALASRCGIAALRQEDLRLCLHEAFANGVMHGNFEIFSGNLASPVEFVEQAAVLERRLADPSFNFRPIEVGARLDGDTLIVWVADDGRGFDANRPKGRGLTLVGHLSNRFWHEANGSKIVMEFRAKAGHGIVN